jgi:hypothetical protein
MIAEARKQLASDLAHAKHPTLMYRPDDPTVVPFLYLGQPSLVIHDQFAAVNFPVWVIGRPKNDDDAQIELDEALEEALLLLRGPDVALSNVDVASAIFTQVAYPAYLITAVLSGQFC